MYKNTCVTGRKEFVKNDEFYCETHPFMSPPFDNLIIKEDKGSLVKCWLFHLNNFGELRSWYRYVGFKFIDLIDQFRLNCFDATKKKHL